jgi:hypothetical protein
MRRLVPCPACQRHVFAHEATCPHCGKPSPGRALAALAVTAGLALAACTRPPGEVYGPAPVDPDRRATTGTEAPTEAPTAAELPSSPTAVYGPAPVRPDDRQSPTTTPSTSPSTLPVPTPTATPTATPTTHATGAPSTGPRPPSAVYGPPPVKPAKRFPPL